MVGQALTRLVLGFLESAGKWLLMGLVKQEIAVLLMGLRGSMCMGAFN